METKISRYQIKLITKLAQINLFKILLYLEKY